MSKKILKWCAIAIVLVLAFGTLKVLFEKRDGEYLIGHAGDYLKVKVKTADNLIGEIVTIKIDKYDEILEGRVV